MYTRIVVPLNGSPLAERALPTAERLATENGASLHLVRVVDLARCPYGAMAATYVGVDRVVAEEATAAESYLSELRWRIRARGVPVTVDVLHGRAARQLVAHARAGDLVVMASRGRSRLMRWLLGGVAEEVRRRSSVPVLLVRGDPGSQLDQPSAPSSAPTLVRSSRLTANG